MHFPSGCFDDIQDTPQWSAKRVCSESQHAKIQNVQRNHGENIPRKISATEGSVNVNVGKLQRLMRKKIASKQRRYLVGWYAV